MAISPTKKRIRALPSHRSFRLTKQKYKQPKKLIGIRKLLKDTVSLILKNKKLLLGIGLIYAVLFFIFVQGLTASSELSEFRANLENAFGQEPDKFLTGATLVGYIFGTVGSSGGAAAGFYQQTLTLIFSLALIWAVRQVVANEKPKIKFAFYRGMYPLIPFLAVIFIIGIQLLPIVLGNLAYGTVVQNGLAVNAVEQVVWVIFFGLLALLSLYMVASSIFGLYIVTLPDMTPIKALRSARDLVLHRRIGVMARVFLGPFLLILFIALVLFVVVLLVPALAQVVFVLALSLSLVIFHTYMYLLYRSLL